MTFLSYNNCLFAPFCSPPSSLSVYSVTLYEDKKNVFTPGMYVGISVNGNVSEWSEERRKKNDTKSGGEAHRAEVSPKLGVKIYSRVVCWAQVPCCSETESNGNLDTDSRGPRAWIPKQCDAWKTSHTHKNIFSPWSCEGENESFSHTVWERDWHCRGSSRIVPSTRP